MGRVSVGFLVFFFDFDVPEATCQIMDPSAVAWPGIAALIPPASARLVLASSTATQTNILRMRIVLHSVLVHPTASASLQDRPGATDTGEKIHREQSVALTMVKPAHRASVRIGPKAERAA
ncbi:MAG TPA: hypothetical protein VJ233_06080 [Hyphomicrobiaceae bacterium]|nr:hypothetical protein [Hyphomicrobiaceae bacterium]